MKTYVCDVRFIVQFNQRWQCTAFMICGIGSQMILAERVHIFLNKYKVNNDKSVNLFISKWFNSRRLTSMNRCKPNRMYTYDSVYWKEKFISRQLQCISTVVNAFDICLFALFTSSAHFINIRIFILFHFIHFKWHFSMDSIGKGVEKCEIQE